MLGWLVINSVLILVLVIFLVIVLQILFSFVSVINPVRRIIGRITDASSAVNVSADQVLTSSQTLSEGASLQPGNIEQISAALEELAGMPRQNAENAGEVGVLSKENRANCERSKITLNRVVEAINEITKSSEKMAQIVKTIDAVAFQKNLLALNAAVEAVRAGDAGRGFAVVAEEVRNLAHSSAEAARRTSDLIEETQDKSGSGVKAAEEMQAALLEIESSAVKANELITEVASASHEQSKGVAQITESVAQMREVTQNTAAIAQEKTTASGEQSTQAMRLTDIITGLLGLVGASGKNDGSKFARDSAANKEPSAVPRKEESLLPAPAYGENLNSPKRESTIR